MINDGRPLLRAIYKVQAGENFYHAVLILGYDSYQYQYTYSGRVNSEMYYYFAKHPEEMPAVYLNIADKCGADRAVCDYISSMTDRYAVYMFNNIFVPRGWTFFDELN